MDPEDPENFRRAIRPNTRAVYGETLGNPLVNVLDIEAVASIAHEHGLPLIIDNTVASPYLCNPFAFGADIVVHSATKYLGGHGTTMAGVLVESGKFDWGSGLAKEKFPEMLEPSRAYHGVKFYETFGDFGYTMKARMEVNRTFGGALSPLNAWLILQGIETLHLRMQAHCRNALRVAEFLSDHPLVGWVNSPGLQDSPHTRWRASSSPSTASGRVRHPHLRHPRRRCGEGGRALHRRLRVPQPPGEHRRRQDAGDPPGLHHPPAAGRGRAGAAGVRPDMIRLSVGIEDVEDILWDLDQALRKAVSRSALRRSPPPTNARVAYDPAATTCQPEEQARDRLPLLLAHGAALQRLDPESVLPRKPADSRLGMRSAGWAAAPPRRPRFPPRSRTPRPAACAAPGREHFVQRADVDEHVGRQHVVEALSLPCRNSSTSDCTRASYTASAAAFASMLPERSTPVTRSASGRSRRPHSPVPQPRSAAWRTGPGSAIRCTSTCGAS